MKEYFERVKRNITEQGVLKRWKGVRIADFTPDRLHVFEGIEILAAGLGEDLTYSESDIDEYPNRLRFEREGIEVVQIMTDEDYTELVSRLADNLCTESLGEAVVIHRVIEDERGDA
jgi:hypothetical protein